MDSGRETAFDPSRHGSMASGRDVGRANSPVGVSRSSFLRELTASLEETQQQASEIAGRLRNNADSLLGSEPEAGRNGAETKAPPISGQIHQLVDLVRNINVTLQGARHQLDRLDAL